MVISSTCIYNKCANGTFVSVFALRAFGWAVFDIIDFLDLIQLYMRRHIGGADATASTANAVALFIICAHHRTTF